ncbi:hypothetical protein E6Q11_06465 [Candidatus Dojkabacteria bacterium]|uniref:Uncharacterized protein n=1 Tax=Candidatus Dojkabacteria bacterium TaxID=2099670 RepID=A0A5C7J4K5_9BACT|nr:MAG: hypothetical protein E6Q11_06465 [Candidatus Dojkabacteria bacterium]
MKKLIFVALLLIGCGDGKDINISNNNENNISLTDTEKQEAEESQKNVCLVCQEKFFGDELQLSACYARHPECASFQK